MIKNTEKLWNGKLPIFASIPWLIFNLICSLIIAFIAYYYVNKNEEEKKIGPSIIVFFLYFITINMFTRKAGITL
tara:strand:+ start:107 stop:331 length:225 start_codon:yes stop_codon:yes gene_type:complete